MERIKASLARLDDYRRETLIRPPPSYPGDYQLLLAELGALADCILGAVEILSRIVPPVP